MNAQQAISQVFGTVAEQADRGSAGTGQVADWLITAGLSAAAISQILNGVATSADATPEMIAYTQNEMQYLQSQYSQPRNNSGLFVALAIGALIVFSSGKD